MSYFGKIKSYDSSAGTGSITPEKGGDALRFKKADLQQEECREPAAPAGRRPAGSGQQAAGLIAKAWPGANHSPSALPPILPRTFPDADE